MLHVRNDDEREEQILRCRRHARVQVLLREAAVGDPKVAPAQSEEDVVGVVLEDEVGLTSFLLYKINNIGASFETN